MIRNVISYLLFAAAAFPAAYGGLCLGQGAPVTVWVVSFGIALALFGAALVIRHPRIIFGTSHDRHRPA